MRLFIFIVLVIIGFSWWQGAGVVGHWIGEHIQAFVASTWNFFQALGEGVS